MALKFTPSAEAANQEAAALTPVAEATPVPDIAAQVEPEFNITVAKAEMQQQILNSDEIDRLTSQIDVSNPNSWRSGSRRNIKSF